MTEEAGSTESTEEGIGGEAEESTMAAGETQARGKGWTDKDEWIDAGKDENEWIPYGAFNKNGSLYAEINKLKDSIKGNDENMANLNKLHAVQLNQTKLEYERQKEEAIKDGNVAEVRAIDRDLQALESADPTGAPQKTDALIKSEWNTANDWIFESATPEQRAKQAFAQNEYIKGEAQGWDVTRILAGIDEAMEGRYTQNGDVNHRRNDPSTSTTGGANDPDATKQGKATIANMTNEEKKLRRNSSFMNSMPDKEFLVLLTNSRK